MKLEKLEAKFRARRHRESTYALQRRAAEERQENRRKNRDRIIREYEAEKAREQAEQEAREAARKETRKRRGKRNKDKAREDRLRKQWGKTLAWYDRVLEAQGGGCAICGASSSSDGSALAVDHDHETGDIRGLLCAGCNRGLGFFKDDPERLRAAIRYLEEQ